MGAADGDKWNATTAAARHRAKPEPQPWGQEKQATWSGMDGRMKKTDLNPVSFTMLGLNTTEPILRPIDLQWDSHFDVDDEWSGINGMAAVDPSSDWNAPVEHWGNYEEPPVLVTLAPPPKEQPRPHKVTEDEKETDDPAGTAANSKKKKKKKKKAEEEAASVSETVSSVPSVNKVSKPEELQPVGPSNKQPPKVPASQKKSEQIMEPPKQAPKKKVRRET
ncbi:uncharacterized protein ACJ7VT_022331 [Polymixia lowei]